MFPLNDQKEKLKEIKKLLLKKRKRKKTIEVDKSGCVEQSKENMKKGKEPKGKEPTCLIDFWMQETVKKLTALSETGETTAALPPNTSNIEIGSYLFDFLFAAQEASPSSLLWAVTLLDSHPEVFAKVREEVKSIWLLESDSLITGDQIVQMKYKHTVACEILRYRAPATR